MNKKAFTLVETLVVIAIIGVLSTFVVIQMNGAINAGKDTQRKSDIQLLANAVVEYASDHYNSKPNTDGNGCTLNGGTDPCSATIEDSLKSYLPTLPDDPNSNASYIYQSNGNDCTISASLSDGTTYQYSCTNDATTTGTPTDGICGGAKKAYLPEETAFSGTYCDGGTLISEPIFPSVQGTEVSWQCAGEYLGSSTTCTAQLGKNGQCGTAARSTTNAYTPSESFSTDYCAIGTVTSNPSDPAQGDSSSWDCPPLYAGTTDHCTAYRGKDGVCGSSDGGSYYASSEITNPCTVGTASTITGSGSSPYTDYWSWTCSAVYTGVFPTCTAAWKVDGDCGASNGVNTSSTPTCLCDIGTPSAVSSSTSWTWTCSGSNGGANTSCSAPLTNSCAYYGGTWTSCGSISCCNMPLTSCPSGWTDTGWSVTSNYCTTSGSVGGTRSYFTPWWDCLKDSTMSSSVNTGEHSWSYTSRSEEYILYTNTYGDTLRLYSYVGGIGCKLNVTSVTCSTTTPSTRQTCDYYGGTWTACGSIPCCRMPLTSCPSGWTDTGWSETSNYCTTSGSVGGTRSYFTPWWDCLKNSSMHSSFNTGEHSWSYTSRSEEYILYTNTYGDTLRLYSTMGSIGCQ